MERPYTLFLHDGSPTPPAFEINFFETPEAAKVGALKLLEDRPRYLAVEVSDALSTFRVERAST